MSKTTGLEPRYEVHKLHDDSGRHDDCRFFVLDPAHDPIAVHALARYADSARDAGFVQLADDLDEWIRTLSRSE